MKFVPVTAIVKPALFATAELGFSDEIVGTTPGVAVGLAAGGVGVAVGGPRLTVMVVEVEFAFPRPSEPWINTETTPVWVVAGVR